LPTIPPAQSAPLHPPSRPTGSLAHQHQGQHAGTDCQRDPHSRGIGRAAGARALAEIEGVPAHCGITRERITAATGGPADGVALAGRALCKESTDHDYLRAITKASTRAPAPIAAPHLSAPPMPSASWSRATLASPTYGSIGSGRTVSGRPADSWPRCTSR